ncbi:fam-a protein [Plasmodium berghei]|uniref:Fam-a protein n=2 Tax=Plasmodium berghei TaxID=5821 RepID=A0A509ALJ4_PLABA|nr:fam-a protein [Plasmodium berghei ANKA]CXI58986.1 fam-a protein [Plasmodium berghei]SCM23402.1 fam-a protein [Plasmodium berghei]SCN26574.1 fam-a protein [Plasmodium berghei]SCO60836.1 fam-a protein [Plasmodium berghei]SCO62814.1 fam-a protein [Plasmodium berghei]|eukprot:XP_034422219.1 fam-a protein [Plasmodium berghei ANKA]
MNKRYINIIFTFLSLLGHMNNKAFASEYGPNNVPSTPASNYSDEKSKQVTSLLCTDPEETKKATEIMNEAIMLLQYHATSTEDYSLLHKHDDGSSEYFKKHGNADIHKFNHKLPNPDSYDSIINILFNYECNQKIGISTVKEKIVREYTPNLVMVQQRYKNSDLSFQGYYYALSKKYKISNDTTVIALASANINDHNIADQKIYKNDILESANSFKTDIDSEEDIRKGKLKKMFVNLSGCLIRKKLNYIEITHISSMNMNAIPSPNTRIKKSIAKKLESFINLRYIFSQK